LDFEYALGEETGFLELALYVRRDDEMRFSPLLWRADRDTRGRGLRETVDVDVAGPMRP
jgi:hypothetical protein